MSPACVALPSMYVIPDFVLRAQTREGKCWSMADQGGQWALMSEDTDPEDSRA